MPSFAIDLQLAEPCGVNELQRARDAYAREHLIITGHDHNTLSLQVDDHDLWSATLTALNLVMHTSGTAPLGLHIRTIPPQRGPRPVSR